MLLSIAVGALGNRIWGAEAGKHWLGTLVMAYAIIIHYPHLWKFTPIIALLVLLFRGISPRPLLDEIHGPFSWKALGRSALILPLSIGLYLMDKNILHLFEGIIYTIFITLIYHLSVKQNKVEPVALSELIVGGLVGSL